MELRLEELRREVQAAVALAIDGVIDRHVRAARPGGAIVEYEDFASEKFFYRWPDGKIEEYDNCHWYQVTGPQGSVRVLFTETQRPVFGAKLKRYIVFGQLGSQASKTLYPFTEFVQTKDGNFAAVIPDPQRPRAAIKDPGSLPARFKDARVEKTHDLFDGVVGGESLRLVVPSDDVEAMISHAYWVAALRKRLRG